MPTRFNPFTGNLDFVGTGVQGPVSSTDNAITRWDGVSGGLIQDSKTVVQDGGGIEAQAFMTRRSVTDLVTVNSGQTWIASGIELELSGSIELEPNAEIVMV